MPRRKAKSKTTGMYKLFRYTKDDDVAARIIFSVNSGHYSVY